MPDRHLDTSRNFNSISFEEKRVIKSSQDHEKLKNELRWYRDIPEDLKIFIPDIKSSNFSKKEANLVMERLKMRSLGHYYCKDRVIDWEKAMSRVFSLFREISESDDPIRADRESLKEMYLQKTLERLGQIDEEVIENFQGEKLTINGTRMSDLDDIKENMGQYLERGGIFERESFRIIHGDFHLSNILYSEDIGMKLVDPRGSFGGHSIYGDPHYDLAKLRHSVKGRYDMLVRDLFELQINGNQIDYEVKSPEKEKKVQRIFGEKMGDFGPEERNRIKRIEPLLFLSMAALHGENLRRQKLILAKGVQMFNERLIDQ